MIKLTTKEDIALLIEEASEMFEKTGCVPDVDGKKVRAEKIVPRARRYILETIDSPQGRLRCSDMALAGVYVGSLVAVTKMAEVLPKISTYRP
jgi:hypothetical protein